MRCSITYKDPSTLSPYDDWIKRNQPAEFYVRYIETGQEMGDRIDFVFLPKKNLLRIRVNWSDNNFGMIARVRVDASMKTISVLSSNGWGENEDMNIMLRLVANIHLWTAVRVCAVFGHRRGTRGCTRGFHGVLPDLWMAAVQVRLWCVALAGSVL